MTDNHAPKETAERTKGLPTQSDLWGDTLQGTQVLFSSIYATLQKSLEQNQQMAHSMAMMMQQVIRTKFRIDTRIESTRLIITLHNATPYTIHIPRGKLILTPLPGFPGGEHTTLELMSSTHRTTGADGQTVDLSLFLPDRLAAAAPHIVLTPNTDHQEVLCVKSAMPIPYHGLIDIQIPPLGHEGDNGINSLHLTHSFGIYIIDQIEKVVVDKEDEAMCVIDEQDGTERTYSGDFLRDTLTIPPVLGLYTGMRICLELACGSSFEEGGVIVCRIDSISSDRMQVRLFGKNKEMLQVLVHELDTLAS